MLRTTLAGLRLHKGRLVTTALAIILGVTFVTGTLVFTDTLDESMGTQIMGSADRVDVIAEPAPPEGEFDPDAEPARLDTAALEEVRALPEVAAATGVLSGDAQLLGADGRAVGTSPPAALSVGGDVPRYEAAEGRLPETGDEVALATVTADVSGFGVGDTAAVLDSDGVEREFTVTGLVDFGLDPGISYRGAVAFTPDTAERVLALEGFATIDVRAAEGVPAETVETAVAQALGEAAEVQTGRELGEEIAESAGAQTGLLSTALLLFAAVSLFVAAIVIYNTFAILVAQRQREMALLRCVGATRRQVFGGVLLEALIIGVLASAVGVAAGIGLGAAGFAFGGELMGGAGGPAAPVVSATAVAAGLLVGTLVTLLSALLPARRATRVPPLAALRTSAVASGLEKGVGWVRIAIGLVFFLASGGLITLALSMEPSQIGMVLVVGAAIVCFVGVLVVSPLLVRTVATVLGWPLRRTGVPGSLAVDNTLRSPKRAATAMIALTVGATLITGYSVIGSSMRTTVEQNLDQQFPVDYMIGSQWSADDESAVVPAAVATALEDSDAVAKVFTERSTTNADGVFVSAYPGAELGSDIGGEVEEGDLGEVGPGSVALTSNLLAELNAELGQTVTLATEEGEESFTVAAVLPDVGPMYRATMSAEDFAAGFLDVQDSQVLVKGAEEASLKELTDAVNGAIADHPTVQVSSAAETRSEFDQVLNTAFLVVSGLLAMAILIAVFGIANTMALSVLERGRESALLRALGLSKAQLRRMLTVEAVLVSVIGAGLGIALGVLFGWAAGAATLSGLVFTLPAAEIAGFIAVAVVAGLLAAVMPARRAARISITGALASE